MISTTGPGHDGAEILNDLRRVQVLGTVLYVAAHPDDENTRLLATLAKESKVRAAYLSFTRGEGGQNLIGSELGPLLGVIRTQELLAARRVDGAEQFFTRARDFGYSKSVDETLAIWDHDRVLADAVWIIRSLRPDVIVTRFSPDQKDTHGHHVASARLALEAFKAAADPQFHPEQLDRVSVWQAKRIVWNAWSRDNSLQMPPGTIQWDSSLFSPLLGYSYGELAALSRSMHKSQGFGAAPTHEGSVENFAPLAGEQAAKTLFDGIDLTWKRVPGSEKFAAALSKAIAEYKPESPASSIPALLGALEELRKLPANPWKEQKIEELVAVITDCAGLFVEASSEVTSVVPGAKLKLNVFVLNRSTAALKLDGVKVEFASITPQGATVGFKASTQIPAPTLEKGKPQKLEFTVDVPAGLSSPYFLEQPPGKGTWTMRDDQPIGPPELSSPFLVEYRFTSGTQSFSVKKPAYFKWTDPTVGERYRPIEVLPPVVVKPGADLLAFTDLNAKTLEVSVTANAEAQEGQVHLELAEGFTSEPASFPFTLKKKGDELKFLFKVKPSAKSSGNASLSAIATIGTTNYARSLTRLEYAHIPIQTVLAPSQVKLMRVDLKRGKTSRVGYIAGAGDDVPQALRQVGYDVTFLSDAALASEDLRRYDAIVVGIRAYNVNPRLPAVTPRLMKYVEDGGTIVAQYNTKNWLSSVPAQIGPFAFEISQDRVTDEDAKPTFEKHRVFTTPNVITDADFTGWVQERGLYFGAKWDPKYETPLILNDPNEAPSKGSLLIAKHGKGRFVYTGLAFFRQLPAGVPGAYRLFANLIDHGT